MNENVSRKRGRPKGSKNKSSRKKEKQSKDILSAQDAFEMEFGISRSRIDPTTTKTAAPEVVDSTVTENNGIGHEEEEEEEEFFF